MLEANMIKRIGIPAHRLLIALFFLVFLFQGCGPSQEELTIGALKHFNRGNQLFNQNNPRGAIAEYKLAIAQDDDQAAFHFNLGLAYYRLVLYNQAIEAYQHAIKLKPKFGEAWYNLSLALDKIGETDKAFLAYERYQELNRSHPVPEKQDPDKPVVLKGPKRPTTNTKQ